MATVYELSQGMVDMIKFMVSQNTVVLAIYDQMPNDSLELIHSHTTRQAEAAGLLTAGLFADYSETAKFKPAIDRAKELSTRTWKVYGLTEDAIMLFTDFGEKESIN